MVQRTRALAFGFLKKIVVAGLGLYSAFAGVLYFSQEHLLFHSPAGQVFGRCVEARQESQSRVILGKKNGESVRMYLRSLPKAQGWLLFFHGNASTACDYLRDFAWTQAGLELNYAFIEYPGFAEESPRSAPQEEFLRSSLAAFDFIAQDENTHRLPIFLYGTSLGSGPATYVASERPAAGLILRSPYTSIVDIAAHRYPLVPVRHFLRWPFPAENWAAKVLAPVLVLHGTDDKTIPYKIGKAQAANFKNLDHLVTFEGAGHNDVATRNPERYWGEIRQFILRVLRGSH